APGGIMGLVARHEPIARIGRLNELVVPYARILTPGLLSVLGFVALVELAQLTTIGASQNKALTIGGQAIDPHSTTPWLIAAAALIGGGLWLRHEARFFRARWDALIEDAKARGLPV